MKKLILFSIAAAISFGAVAQNKHSNKNKQKGKYSKHASHKKDNRYDDDRRNVDYRYDQRNDRNDDRYDRRDDRYDNDRYSKNNNLPRKVSDAFRRDYPNASNVNWSKDRGIWSANFKRSGLFGGNNTVSYKANGQRVDANRNNRNEPVYGRNDRRQQQPASNPVYDKVFGRNQ